MTRWCKVVVVDDSAFMRLTLSRMLNEDPEIEVVGTASNGAEGVELVKALRPSVVTMDVEMPVMDGLTALERIMRECPTPVVMVSALTREGAEVTFKALQLGAVDFVAKPSGSISWDFYKVREEFVAKVKNAARATLQRFSLPSKQTPFRLGKTVSQWSVVVIAASTGGPSAIRYVLSQLPEDLPAAVLVVQHMPIGFTNFFADNLRQVSTLPVHEAKDGEVIQPCQVYLAPSGYHMVVAKEGRLKLDTSPPLHNVRPAADKTLESAAHAFKSRCVGVVMTGMGHDGAVGLLTVRELNGRTLAQAPESCVIDSMPRSAINLGAVQEVVPLEQLPQRLAQVAVEAAVARQAVAERR